MSDVDCILTILEGERGFGIRDALAGSIVLFIVMMST